MSDLESDAAQIAAPTVPRRASAPTALPMAVLIGTAVAVALLCGGVVLLRDSAVHWEWLGGDPWVRTALKHVDGLGFDWSLAPLGVILAVVGIWLVVCGLLPRRRTALAVAAPTSMWLPLRHLGRLVSHAAGSVAGVRDVSCKVSRSRIAVTVEVDALASPTQLRSEVSAAVSDAVGVLVRPPRVSVRLKGSTTENAR
ncbi:DUF6286 domain-containing protein [Mycobacterium sp. C31M]